MADTRSPESRQHLLPLGVERPSASGHPADRLNPESPTLHPAPLPRRRVGRAAVLAWLKEQVGVGRGLPDAAAVAAHFCWQLKSAQDALMGLAADGFLRVAGREPPRGKIIYELTAAGCAARSKVCSRCNIRKGEASFWPSRQSHDGLSAMCKVCCRNVDGAKRSKGRRAAALAAGLT